MPASPSVEGDDASGALTCSVDSSADGTGVESVDGKVSGVSTISGVVVEDSVSAVAVVPSVVSDEGLVEVVEVSAGGGTSVMSIGLCPLWSRSFFS